MDALDKLNFKVILSRVLVDASTKVWVNELESRNECYMYRYRYKYAEFQSDVYSYLYFFAYRKKNIIQELTLTGHGCQNAIGCS